MFQISNFDYPRGNPCHSNTTDIVTMPVTGESNWVSTSINELKNYPKMNYYVPLVEQVSIYQR